VVQVQEILFHLLQAPKEAFLQEDSPPPAGAGALSSSPKIPSQGMACGSCACAVQVQ